MEVRHSCGTLLYLCMHMYIAYVCKSTKLTLRTVTMGVRVHSDILCLVSIDCKSVHYCNCTCNCILSRGVTSIENEEVVASSLLPRVGVPMVQ